MPKVLISDNLSKVAVDVFTNNKIEVDVKTDLTVEELKKEIINYEGLVVRSATKVNQEIIECGKI